MLTYNMRAHPNMQQKEIHILVGIHGCGKTSYAMSHWKHKGYHLSWEDVRRWYRGKSTREVYHNMMKLFKRALLDKRPKFSLIIIDSTNLTYKQRKNYYTLIEKYCPRATVYISYWIPDAGKCIFWNSRRPKEKQVPVSTILEDIDKIEYPYEAVSGFVEVLETDSPEVSKERTASVKYQAIQTRLSNLKEVAYG